MTRYNPQEIQKRWQQKWVTDKTFVVNLEKAEKPFFNLMMFPYPSGEGLHVGHVYAFGGADTFGHFKKMQGNDVFEPMGFDSFGIHSENYAIKVGKHPKQLIEETTKYFKEEQLQRLGALFDWDHAVTTSDPDYYKWTQWLFIQLFKAGLAVRKKAAVEWCPNCKTVLADEQVIAGKCERCHTEVIQKELEQWFFKITDYAQKLLDNLETLPDRQSGIDWSETTKTMQKNWIGWSEGTEIEFKVKGSGEFVKVYTTRPDTIYGATFLVLAPENPIIDQIVSKDSKEKVSDYINEAKNKNEVERATEKTGIFSGSYAVNPFTKKDIPIWIADYVLVGYGTGSIMAVPAHDQRDYEFARKYDLPIVEVISGGEVEKRAWDGEGKLINSDNFSNLSVEEAKEKISEYIESKKIGSKKVNFHLRDWLISRQRYWGPPIPMVFCESCAKAGKSWFASEEAEKTVLNKENLSNFKEEMKGWYPVNEKDLPVVLPEVENFKPLGTGKSPLASVDSFVRTVCPECGREARRETDVSDTFLDSSWYFLRYPSTEFNDRPFDKKLTKKWLPVDMYIGGNEHAVLHLLYSRFVTMALHDMGFLDFEEPYKKFRALGLIIYKGAKMSKSRGNVINPNEYINAYGADALRMYLLFIGPYELGGEFNDRAITGVYRFLSRIWTLVTEEKWVEKNDANLQKDLNQLIEKLTADFENLKFNTAVAALMEFLNKLYKSRTNLSREIIRTYILLLAPLAPFTTEELWQFLKEDGSIHEQAWPKVTDAASEEENSTVVIQVNGRFRDKIEVKVGTTQDEAARLALDRPNVKVYTQGNKVKQIIWVEGKLLNFVI